MAESERIQGSNPTSTLASTSRKRFGSDANAKRFQEALLSLDLFPAPSIVPVDDLDGNASTSLPVEPAAASDSEPTSSEETMASSEENEEEEQASSVNASVTDSYPLLCNPVGCRAPDGESVDQEAGLDEKTIVPNSEEKERGRSKNKDNRGESMIAAAPNSTPERNQGLPVPAEPTAPMDQELSQADSEAPTTKPQEIASEDGKSQDENGPILSEMKSTQVMKEDRGGERSKQTKVAKSNDEFRDPASVQPVAISSPVEVKDGVTIPVELESSQNEDLPPSLTVDESDLQPKSRRSDRLDRERKSGGDKEESLGPQSEAPSSEFASGSIAPIEASLASGITSEAVVGTEAAISGEITAAGLIDATDTVVATVSTISAPPAITVSPTQGDLNLATSAGNVGAIQTESTSSLGASFGSSGGSKRVDAGSGSSPGATSVRGPLTPFQESKLVQRVLRGFEQLQDGGGQVRLRLHPPELGTLQMTLRIESMQVSARLEVENTVARDALIQNAQALKDQLAAQGFEVERFEVEIRSEVGGDSSGPEQRSDRRGEESRYQSLESRYAAMQANRVAGDGRKEQEPTPRPTWFRNGNNLDLTV